MEQGRPGSEFPDENARLSKQIDDILAGVADEHVRDQLMDFDRRDTQRSRETALIADITGMLDDVSAAEFNALYGGTVRGHRALEAIDVMQSLESNEPIDSAYVNQARTTELMISLNRIVLDASFTEQGTDGTLRFGMQKADVQLAIITDDIFTPELKAGLITVIDRTMPGEPLDTTDPDAVAKALFERSDARKRVAEQSHRRQIVLSELLRFAHFDDHPDFDRLMSDVREAVCSGASIARVVHTFARDPRLDAIGIPSDGFVTAIVDIYTLLADE